MPLTTDRKQRIVRLLDPATGLLLRLARTATLDVNRRPFQQIVAEPSAVTSILVVRLDTIGDVLLTEPAVAALHSHFPNAAIHFLGAGSGCALLANNPAVTAFHRFDAPWHRAWRGQAVDWSADLQELRRVTADLRPHRFDLAFELRGDMRDTAVAVLAGAEGTVGAPTRGGAGLLDHSVQVDERAHRIWPPLQVVATAGVPIPADPWPRLYPSAGDQLLAGELIPQMGGVVALHLGSGFESKCLPIPSFAAIVRLIREQSTGTRFVVVGGAEDRSLVRALFAALGESVPLLDLTGKLSLTQSAAVLARCSVFIGNDAAPMHIAASVGIPVIAFFGPSDPDNYGPWGPGHTVFRTDLPCSPCDHVHCVQAVRYLCMQQMDPVPAAAAAVHALAQGRAGAGV